MKIKDLERSVNVSWSPAAHYPILLATGTAAQQMDATFSTNAALELYSLNLNEPGMDMEVKASITSDYRFHKLIWGSYNGGSEHGVIVGGCDSGLVQMYNASKLLAGEECLISKQEKHTGSVQSLDFNPFQHNLLATGAAESEIFIWDLNNTSTPMTPGSKSQPYENIQCLAWNRQVQHILSTAFHTRCVVWDLRKNEPIIKLTDTSTHIRWKSVSWHPEVATQLCLASEEDQAPVIQLWDLRFATSPLKVMDNHQRGVLTVAWCVQDPDLLISCGKDNRILCWNPNSNLPRGEVLSEVAQTIEWTFDMSWCPRNPALIAAASFDGHISVYSLMGGKQQQVQTTNKIADSFPGMDGYAQAPVPQQPPPVSVDLSKAPKWLKRPVGASFGFGGRLITFENDKTPIQQEQQSGQIVTVINRSVYISQVITESELVEKANELEQSIQLGNFVEYCQQKADSARTQHEKYVWYFLKANFQPNPKAELLNLLGFQLDDVNMKLSQFLKKSNMNDINQLTNQLTGLNQSDGFNIDTVFDSIGTENRIELQENQKPVKSFHIKTGDDTDGLITQAILIGNIETAVELCLESNRMADALIIAMTGGSELLARTQYRYLQQSEGYVSSLISALVSEDWSTVINQCSIDSWKEALAAALTYSSNEELPTLCERLGERLETECNGNVKLLQDAQLCYICAGSFNKLVASWSKEVSSQNPEKLQELVELVTFMQKAVEHQGRYVNVSGNLADLLSHYAILLSSQGNLNSALNYLGSSSDTHLSELRDRLYCCLGHKTPYPQQQQQQQQSQHRLSNARHSLTNPNQFAQPYQKFNTGLPNTTTQAQSWTNTVNAPVSPLVPSTITPLIPNAMPVAPPTQPQRPPSVGPIHGTRNKYVVDPSVQSNLPPQQLRTSYASNSLGPASLPQMLQPDPSNSPHPTFMNPMQTQGLGASIPGSFPPTPPVDLNQQQQQQPPLFHLHQNSSAPGWNDPPPLVLRQLRQQYNEQNNMSAQHSGLRLWKNRLSHNEPKPEYTPPLPITHPLYPTDPINQQQINNGFVEPPFTGGGAFNQIPPGISLPPPPVNNFQPPIPQQQQQQYQQQQQQQYQQQQQLPPPQPKTPIQPDVIKTKEPLPEEHMYLQTVFDELRSQCSCAANNPQTKRKLEDVSKKLDALYDMLREHKLSPNALSALHQMVQMVQIGDYAGGLALHTQLVSGPDFAQIASFMPGLKVLLQCALQLQVYLR